jgi:DNA-binding CsgD family transcriptional regulator
MTDLQQDIDRLILDIHAAPLEPARWQQVVTSLCQIHGAGKAQLFSIPIVRGASFWNVSAGVSPEANAEYSAQFAHEDVWVIGGRRHNATLAGTIAVGEELIDRRDYLKTRFYNEFLAPHDVDGFMHVVLREPMFAGAPPAAVFSLFRGVGKETFGADERNTLRRLAPHLILAVNTFWRARELSLHNAVLGQTLDAVSAPLFIVDGLGRLLFTNAAAEDALRAGDCLRVEGGCLVPSPSVRERKVCVEALRDLLHRRAATVSLTVGPAGRSVILSTAPLSESVETLAPWGSSAGIVWLVPMRQSPNPVRRIATLFALTGAEERLLAHLAAGSSLTTTAESLRVSIHTARSQLKAIQRKTGWRTQGELVRMVQQLSIVDPQFSR